MARRRGRKVNGILLLDKPIGCSSNAALQRVKRLFDARKAGHTGSLDPLASGLLPLCFGEATKVSGFLLDADKRYWVRARLGVRTATGDAEGEVVATDEAHAKLTRGDVESVLSRFRGDIEQVPPMYSAVKHKGRRLYELAREGIEVEREARGVRIYDLALGELDGAHATFELRCSKGTYVRTLIEDIAAAAGTCAHVVALRRLSVGPFGEQRFYTVEELEQLAGRGRDELDAALLPAESGLGHWPAVTLDPDSAFYLSRGQAIQVPQAPTAGWVRIYDGAQKLLGVGEVLDDGRIAPRRMLGM